MKETTMWAIFWCAITIIISTTVIGITICNTTEINHTKCEVKK